MFFKYSIKLKIQCPIFPDCPEQTGKICKENIAKHSTGVGFKNVSDIVPVNLLYLQYLTLRSVAEKEPGTAMKCSSSSGPQHCVQHNNIFVQL
jgi:hypothetical protein